jgi:hypothetical protein
MPPWRTEPDLHKAFDRTKLPDDTRYLKGEAEWRSYNEITERAARVRSKATSRFEKTFDVRVMQETKRLINKAGSKERHFRFGQSAADNFDPDQLRIRAQEIVRLRHDKRLIRIELAQLRLQESVTARAKLEHERAASKTLRKDWRLAGDEQLRDASKKLRRDWDRSR